MTNDERSQTHTNERVREQDHPRVDEEGDTAEPDSPTAEIENAGMNTILGDSPLTGVQADASDE
jgi:hypothetical protein